MAVSSELRRKIETEYPTFAYLLEIPDLVGLLTKATQEGWDTVRLQNQLYATRWWKTRSELARNWDTLVATDPGEVARQRAIRRDEIATEVRRLGVNLKPFDIALIAEDSLRGGWDPTRITQRIAALARGKGLQSSGEIRATMQDLRALGKAYAVNISNQTLADWSFAIATGRLTEDGVRAHMVNIAKTRLDPRGENNVLRQALDQGLTVRDAYGSVIETVAGELEMDSSRIDLTNNFYGSLLDFVDDKGVSRPMTQTEAVQWARKQSAWQETTKAKEAYSGLANAMTARWGLRK